MKNNRDVKISYWAAHLTTIVSVSLVLIIIGIIALIYVSATNETRRLRERLEVSVVMADTISDAQATEISGIFASAPYAHSVKVITKKDALLNWKNDTGEDLESLFGVNPLSPEVTFSIKADYSTASRLDSIGKVASALPGVESVALPDSTMVESMNRNIQRFAIILGIIAVVMVVISFVLINNTVHLAIYARRFTIHTMQLVGATNGFIRSPFVLNNMLSGLIAGLIAAGLIAVVLIAAPGAGFKDIADYISLPIFGIVAAGMLVTGVMLCGLAAWMSTSRYLGKDYDELFK
ncbi:MAG: permease-like cell division protein FtsX [Muribaculaceae bacterium]|nr:permease-like cell division protein FtsX [Muribaculaceae bacterium]